MTAEVPANNLDETLEQDNSSGTGEEVDDVGAVEEHLDAQVDTPEEESFWSGSPDELPEELQQTYKGMQSAFTKRMQRTAALEKKYFDSIDAANAAVLARSQVENAPVVPEPVEEEPPPDLSKGANPEDVIKYYADQAVKKAMEASGVGDLAKEMQPVAHREKVVGAYRAFATENPDLDHGKLAPLAGRIIDSDEELSALASVNPNAAIRLAARVAQAEMSVAATKQKSRKKRQAAPVSARSGTPVTRKRESMLDAATRALKEAGFNSEGF